MEILGIIKIRHDTNATLVKNLAEICQHHTPGCPLEELSTAIVFEPCNTLGNRR